MPRRILPVKGGGVQAGAIHFGLSLHFEAEAVDGLVNLLEGERGTALRTVDAADDARELEQARPGSLNLAAHFFVLFETQGIRDGRHAGLMHGPVSDARTVRRTWGSGQ